MANTYPDPTLEEARELLAAQRRGEEIDVGRLCALVERLSDFERRVLEIKATELVREE